MNKVQEALKAAIDEINDLIIHIKDREPMTLFSSAEIVLSQCKSALSELDKCEPVAYIKPDFLGRGYAQLDDKYEFNFSPTITKHEPIPLYLCTSPQPKEWVGLSESDIDDVYNDWTTSDHMDFAKDICEKLKQLNTKG